MKRWLAAISLAVATSGALAQHPLGDRPFEPRPLPPEERDSLIVHDPLVLQPPIGSRPLPGASSGDASRMPGDLQPRAPLGSPRGPNGGSEPRFIGPTR